MTLSFEYIFKGPVKIHNGTSIKKSKNKLIKIAFICRRERITRLYLETTRSDNKVG